MPQQAVQHPGEASRREKDQVDLVARALSGLPVGGQAGSLEEGPSLQEDVSPCPSKWIGRWSGSRASARERSQERGGADGAEEEQEEEQEERDGAEKVEERKSEGEELPEEQVKRKLASSALVMYKICKLISQYSVICAGWVA